jgi:hypothetical protein
MLADQVHKIMLRVQQQHDKELYCSEGEAGMRRMLTYAHVCSRMQHDKELYCSESEAGI